MQNGICNPLRISWKTLVTARAHPTSFYIRYCRSWIILHGWRNWDRIKSSFCTWSCFRHRSISSPALYSKKDNAAEDIKIFKKNLKAYRSDEYIYRALNIVRQLLERSDPSREWGYEPDNQPEFISKLRDEVDKIYLKFYTDLRDTEFPVKRLPTCSDTLCKMVIMDSRIYPVLPALFTLSAVYQAALDKSPGKAALLEFIIQPSLTDSCFTDNAYKTKVLSKLAYRLLNKIENTLIDNLNKYNTVVFPSKHINCPPSISALKFDDQQPPSEKVCFNQHMIVSY